MIPWEERKTAGYFKSLWENIKQVLFSSNAFFDSLSVKEGFGEPLHFYLAVTAIVSLINLMVSLSWNAIFPPQQPAPAWILPVATLVGIPLLALAIFVGAAFLHLGVLIFGGKGGYKGTFNIIAYSGAASVFGIIPVLGGAVSGIWGMVVTIKGIKKIHNLGTAKAIFAYLFIPFLIFVIIALLAAIAIPNLLRARVSANDVSAAASLRTIATAIESYKAAQGRYPSDESALIYAQPPYLSQKFDKQSIQGYNFTLSLGENSYEIKAEPVTCDSTGTKNLKIRAGENITEERCFKK